MLDLGLMTTVGLPLLFLALTAGTSGASAQDDPAGSGKGSGSDAGGQPSSSGEGGQTAGSSDASPDGEGERMVTLPESQVIEMRKDQEELTRRRAEAQRLRDRAKKRAATDARAASDATDGDGGTAAVLQEVRALTQALRQATQSPSGDTPIPGLVIGSDGEVTYHGTVFDPATAKLLIDSHNRGESQQKLLASMQERLDDLTETINSERQAKADAETTEIETRHIHRMQSLGLATCDQEFDYLDDGLKAVMRRAYLADLNEILDGLESRGVMPEEIGPEIIAKVSKPILQALTDRLGDLAKVSAKAKDAAADAKSKEPLKRGGSAAEPGRTSAEPTTPEEREAYVAQQAKELADMVHGEGSRPSQVEPGQRNY